MGIFGSFKQARETIDAAKKDVRRPADEVAARRQQKNQQQNGGGKK
jgi:hypothetical protein